jgi:hypothetical protein
MQTVEFLNVKACAAYSSISALQGPSKMKLFNSTCYWTEVFLQKFKMVKKYLPCPYHEAF